MANKKLNILVADDQTDILRSAEILFKSEGFNVVCCTLPTQVLAQIADHDFDLLLVDLNYQSDTTSGKEGLTLVKNIRQQNAHVPIIVMTAWASVDIAVNAMKLGANDFITKPWDVERLLSIIGTQIELAQTKLKQQKLESENRILRNEHNSELVCQSPAMQQIIETFKRIAHSDTNVLITGENGTGKTQLAHMCHQVSSRNNQPFISINMGALAESVFESEMFGHQKGAFTGANNQRIGRFELADGGTLFLDEIANINEKQQAALLRLLETGEFERVGSSKTLKADVRVICATNANLQQKVNEGTFRQDLFYRINTVPIVVPPLIARREDILILAEHFIQKYSNKYQRKDLSLTQSSKQALLMYSWPGNVRELQHSIERAILLSSEKQIQPENLGLTADTNSPITAATTSPQTNQNLINIEGKTLAEIEYQMLDKALIKYIRKPDEAAKSLGISRSAFYRKLAKYGFDLT
ncbi:sigma-54-dependent transcriptional regulator [Catenovulum agarivorans]|uniref:sigma-54-dependent transcriptional regulator n=1 Tax=Catenovulum agarivorans TaxID=1172192 RepID=UPI00030BB5AD|nr:sigma-54 dependent transcriptional regulator [Catenovulum agarivorans]